MWSYIASFAVVFIRSAIKIKLSGKDMMMSIFCSSLPSPVLITLPSSNNTLFAHSLTASILRSSNKKDFSLSAASAFFPDTDLGYSENELKEHGVTFTGIGDDCVVKMAIRNGNSAKLMLPGGLITSFRALMWHGGTVELLHTSVTQGQNGALVQGGLSLALALKNESGVSWAPNNWVFHQVKGNPEESVQVELISRNQEGDVEVKHVIGLWEDHLTSEIIVSNSNASSPLRLVGSVLSHLTLSTPDATYAIGLEGSDYFARPPVLGDFSIIPPDSGNSTDQDFGKLWAFDKLFPKSNERSQNTGSDEEMEGEEDDNYKHLREKLSRIYTSAPQNVTIIDRGRRNSVMVRRNGFSELYMFSPGSEHEFFGKYSYICVGHAALLEPITVNAGSEWRGGLQLWNPNS